MSFTARLSQVEREWYAAKDPSRRPVQLPLPKLDYGSDFEVWEWKFRNLLKHNSLLCFIDVPGPPVTPAPRNSQEQLDIAAATHCLVLLGSCVSEHILADILIPSQDNRLPEDPFQLFQKVKKFAASFRHIRGWKGGNPSIWDHFTGRATLDSTPAVREVLQRLGNIYRMRDKDNRHTVIIVAVLVVKRSYPSLPPEIIRKYVQKATDGQFELNR